VYNSRVRVELVRFEVSRKLVKVVESHLVQWCTALHCSLTTTAVSYYQCYYW